MVANDCLPLGYISILSKRILCDIYLYTRHLRPETYPTLIRQLGREMEKAVIPSVRISTRYIPQYSYKDDSNLYLIIVELVLLVSSKNKDYVFYL